MHSFKSQINLNIIVNDLFFGKINSLVLNCELNEGCRIVQQSVLNTTNVNSKLWVDLEWHNRVRLKSNIFEKANHAKSINWTLSLAQHNALSRLEVESLKSNHYDQRCPYLEKFQKFHKVNSFCTALLLMIQIQKLQRQSTQRDFKWPIHSLKSHSKQILT